MNKVDLNKRLFDNEISEDESSSKLIKNLSLNEKFCNKKINKTLNDDRFNKNSQIITLKLNIQLKASSQQISSECKKIISNVKRHLNDVENIEIEQLEWSFSESSKSTFKPASQQISSEPSSSDN